MLAFSNDYYGMIFRATQSVELFCAYRKKMEIAFRFRKKEDVFKYYQTLDSVNRKDVLIYLRTKYRVVDFLFRMIIKILNH